MIISILWSFRSEDWVNIPLLCSFKIKMEKEQSSTSGLIRYSTCIIEQKLQIIIKKFSDILSDLNEIKI